MKMRFSLSILLGLALTGVVYAQDGASAPDGNSGATPGQNGGNPRMGMGMGRRGGGIAMMGRGVVGIVSEAAADHFTVKTFEGDTYTVQFGDNTRFMKMQGGMGGRGGMRGQGGIPPEQIKAGEIKVGDAIATGGEVNSPSRIVGATTIMLLDPEVARRMQQMAAEYGKTWLMGKVTDIEGTKVTLIGSQDHATHSFTVNENTGFREQRNPVTLADIKTGDMVRVQGAVSDGTFTASSVNVMGMPQRMGNGPGSSSDGAGGGPNQ